MANLKIKYIIICSIFLMLCESCSNVPSCADEEVVTLVLDLFVEDYRETLENNYFNEKYNTRDVALYAYDRGIDTKNTPNEISIPLMKLAINRADSIIENLNPYLNVIRIIETDKELKRCKCASELIYGNDETHVEYMAQYTEDNLIYVELNY